MKFHYCPTCAYMLDDGVKECPFCHQPPVDTEQDMEYYIQLAKERYEHSEFHEMLDTVDLFYLDKANDIATEEEYKLNPLFSENAYNARVNKIQSNYNEYSKKQLDKTVSANLPTCPICHSTNLKNISAIKAAAHWYAFGLLSKTARSQWECKNCGTKF